MAESNGVFFAMFMINIIIFCFKFGRAAVYTVGDEEGWTSEVNYGLWSKKYNFSVGDVLVFKYVKGEHNAYEVTEAAYRSCDTSNIGGILTKYESGSDQVELTQAKKYWFICSVSGHCYGGMRFKIDVKESLHKFTAQTPMPFPLSPNSSAISYDFGRWSFCFCLFVFGLILL